jgi:hypothetical protein
MTKDLLAPREILCYDALGIESFHEGKSHGRPWLFSLPFFSFFFSGTKKDFLGCHREKDHRGHAALGTRRRDHNFFKNSRSDHIDPPNQIRLIRYRFAYRFGSASSDPPDGLSQDQVLGISLQASLGNANPENTSNMRIYRDRFVAASHPKASVLY